MLSQTTPATSRQKPRTANARIRSIMRGFLMGEKSGGIVPPAHCLPAHGMVGICRAKRRARGGQSLDGLRTPVWLISVAKANNVGIPNNGTVAQNTSNGIGDRRPVAHIDSAVFVHRDTVILVHFSIPCERKERGEQSPRESPSYPSRRVASWTRTFRRQIHTPSHLPSGHPPY